MDTLSRRRFLAITGVGVVAVAAGGVALAVRQLVREWPGKLAELPGCDGFAW